MPNRASAAHVFGATVQKLHCAEGCGVLVQLHLRMELLGAPAEFFPCAHNEEMPCNQQCEGADETNFMRFVCSVRGEAYSASTHAGYTVPWEPIMHTIVSCRLPEAPDRLDLVDIDGLWTTPLTLTFCRPPSTSFSSPSRSLQVTHKSAKDEPGRIALCIRPHHKMQTNEKLFSDWVRYHLLLGVDHFFIYDTDGSMEAMTRPLVEAGYMTYTGRFFHEFGDRLPQMVEKSRKFGCCGDKVSVNHCMALAQAQQYDWLVYIRVIDKFLHADASHVGPRMLVQLLERRSKADLFLLHRHDCGGSEEDADTDAAIFLRWPRCVTSAATKADATNSWVPIMRLSAMHLALGSVSCLCERCFC
eukprot:TRINITY_DN37302_c0_g2_i1.p1 TRINITY_DN37302_c0_g2~~TRINITY_DN37302_c0_g2_i1.p1  ORF type:complete len:359 (+),score=35.85 TRINITY_DN37302_c0_g2_i1:463-1539(+)